MSTPICVKIYSAPPLRIREILRYAGVRGEAPELTSLLHDCLDEAEGSLTYKVCYRTFPVLPCEDGLDLGFTRTVSSALQKNLADCGSAVLFAATVGIALDRLIARYGTQSPAKALLLQAIGAERIESLCDTFEREIAAQAQERGFAISPRFSPGYGDFPLEMQRAIFAVLDCPRKIGLSLNDSLLMTPSKSVTALIGIKGATE